MRFIISVLLGILLSGCISQTPSEDEIRTQILEIFKAADAQNAEGLGDYLSYLDKDVTLMPHDHAQVTGISEYKQHVLNGWEAGTTVLTHQLIDFDSFEDVVVARGRAVGTFQPSGSEQIYPFETKNLFVFKRTPGGALRVWRVIFNMTPMRT